MPHRITSIGPTSTFRLTTAYLLTDVMLLQPTAQVILATITFSCTSLTPKRVNHSPDLRSRKILLSILEPTLITPSGLQTQSRYPSCSGRRDISLSDCVIES